MIDVNKESLNLGGIVKEETLDEVIEQLRDTVAPIIDQIEKEENIPRAALVIGAREITEDGETVAIQSIVDICGDYGVLGEALYNELISGIESKKPELFQLIREVIRTIEQEMDIDTDQPYEQERTLH